ncbi:MAG TPA: MFS transporter [Anaerolineaceae bacterium]|nr:MFS transporter [Anaerolineaceae bacterium]HPN51090.1 MFS transporter [Anaerolineaceae bacterium]
MSETVAVSKQSFLNGTMKRFMFAMLLANIAVSMYDTLLPLYLKQLNANVVQVGLFFTLAQIIPLALQILGGWISDSLGRLRSIAWGSVAGVFSFIGIILAPTWEWVLLGIGLSAVTRALVGPSFGSFIAEQSSEENRGRVYALSESIFSIVTIVGPPLGGWLAETYGFKMMLIAGAMLYIVATLVRVSMAQLAAKGETGEKRSLSLGVLKNSLGEMTGLILAGGVITWLLITDGVRDVAFSLSFQLMPLYLEGIGRMSLVQIGWLNSIFGVTSLAVTMPAGWLSDKKGERVAIACGFLLEFSALMVFIYAPPSFLGYAISWALFGLGVGLMSPAYQSLISKAVPDRLRGTAMGLMNTSLGLFSLPAPAIGAQLWSRFTPRLPFMITAVVSIASVVPVWLKFRLPARKDAEPTP